MAGLCSQRERAEREFKEAFERLKRKFNVSDTTRISSLGNNSPIFGIIFDVDFAFDQLIQKHNREKLLSCGEDLICSIKCYEDHYKEYVDFCISKWLFEDHELSFDAWKADRSSGRSIEFTPPAAPDYEEDTTFDPRFHNGGLAIESAFEYLRHHSPWGGRETNEITIGIEAFDYLTSVMQFDLASIFENASELDVIRSQHLKHEAQDMRGSIRHLLEEAYRSYAVGNIASCLVLCRAIWEMAIADLYLDTEAAYHKQKPDENFRRRKRFSCLIKAFSKLKTTRFCAGSTFEFEKEKDRADSILHRYTQTTIVEASEKKLALRHLKIAKDLIEKAP